jgi:hypothetical protein
MIFVAWVPAVSRASGRKFIGANAREILITGISILSVGFLGFGVFIVMALKDLPFPVSPNVAVMAFCTIFYIGWMIALLPIGVPLTTSINKAMSEFFNNQPLDSSRKQ